LLELERAQPDVLIFDLHQSGLDEAIRRIRKVCSAPVIVVHGTADAQTLLDVMRAGVRDLVCPPLQTGLRSALDRVAAERPGRETAKRLNGKLLGFLSAKGGCGATTIACHLAVALQQLTQENTLLSDLDMTAGIVRFLMKAQTPYSMLDAAQNVDRLDLSFWKALVSNGFPHLEVIPGPAEPFITEFLDPAPFREVLRFVRTRYAWVISDLGHGLSPFSLTLLEEMDEVFVVANLEVPTLYRTKDTVQALKKIGFSEGRLHLILNRMASRCDIPSEELEAILGLEVHTRLPDGYSELYEAYAEGRLLSPSSQLAKHFARLAMKIAGIPDDKRAGGFSFFGLNKTAPRWQAV
jgi:pilus assembly protein CpaE